MDEKSKAPLSQSNADHFVVLGGTFDPVHNGHLISAQALVEAFGYEKVYLMPCGDAYHKGATGTVADRVTMLKLAIKDKQSLGLDLRENQSSRPHIYRGYPN